VKNPSVAWRVILFLLLAQIPALVLFWAMTMIVAFTGVFNYAMTLDEFAVPRAFDLVSQSVVRSVDGTRKIEPSPELLDDVKASGLKFAAFDSESYEPLVGSSTELVAMLNGVIRAKPMMMQFMARGEDATQSKMYLEVENTPAGRMSIVISGAKFRWYDVYYSMKAGVARTAVFSSASIALTLVIAWFAVRNGLAPVKAVARKADHIDMDTLHQRLPVDGAPAEIAPLVGAVNQALGRLDASAARMRRYTANVAHELRTPLAIMRARLEDTEEPSFRADLARDVSQLQAIVEQLLIAARLREQQAPLEQRVELAETVRQVVADYAVLAIKAGCGVSFESDRSPVLVRGNRRAIECVVANLLDNALKAERKGETIFVRVGADATIAVVDHGEGVSVEDREKIFEPFWRKSNQAPGAGLGLGIAKELIEMQGGDIFVEETPGGGATFKIVLAQKFIGRFEQPGIATMLLRSKELN